MGWGSAVCVWWWWEGGGGNPGQARGAGGGGAGWASDPASLSASVQNEATEEPSSEGPPAARFLSQCEASVIVTRAFPSKKPCSAGCDVRATDAYAPTAGTGGSRGAPLGGSRLAARAEIERGRAELLSLLGLAAAPRAARRRLHHEGDLAQLWLERALAALEHGADLRHVLCGGGGPREGAVHGGQLLHDGEWLTRRPARPALPNEHEAALDVDAVEVDAYVLRAEVKLHRRLAEVQLLPAGQRHCLAIVQRRRRAPLAGGSADRMAQRI